MSEKIVLSVEGIVKKFPGTIALNNVHIEVNEGEVHALVGENGAGKSTLMNIISGVFPPDSGKIFFMGREVDFNNPKEAQDMGIGFVHQELSLCPHLSVAENIFMGRVPTNKIGLTDYKKLFNKSKELLELFHASFSPWDLVGNLNVAEQQIVEIGKALSLDCKLLILDEPTSSLTETETVTLFRIIKDIKAKGISVLYISHRMAEIFEICDSITVFRDGTFVNKVKVQDVNSDDVIQMMVGRNIHNLYPKKSESVGKEVLSVRNFNKKGVFQNISFSVNKGEILGFYGLVGAGRTEVARAICGIDDRDSGEVYLNGDLVENKNYRETITNGFAYLTEDRKQQGLFLQMTIKQNITAAKLDIVTSGIVIDKHKETDISQKYVNRLNIKISSLDQKVANLSGGNQQKVMIGKWLATNPKVLIMDEPTRGIDVGAKAEIHTMLRELSNQGITVIIISSELPEIIGMSDRVIVMHEGHITGEVVSDEISEENIIKYASDHCKEAS